MYKAALFLNILLLFRRQARFASIGAQRKCSSQSKIRPDWNEKKNLHRLCFLITHEHYRRVLRHLQENTLSASDLSRIQNALTFLSPLCRDTREAHKDMMGVTLKTDALLRSSR